MKCPKCGYIGFETTDRCRNCGYEFALAHEAAADPELPMRADDPGGPLADLALQPDPVIPRRRRPGRQPLDLDRVIGAPGDLPLFDSAGTDGLAPMLSPPAVPRRPLGVRRPTPDPSRLPRVPDAAGRSEATPAPAQARKVAGRAQPETGPSVVVAPRGTRALAAITDTVLLAAINGATFYFTLRLCGLTTAEWHVLPVLPLAAFFLLLDGGYLVAFTAAGGQTIGKMAFGLKVVGPDHEPVSVAVASVRALGAIASTLCLGAGLVPALARRDGRALHDRLADTHVVRLAA